MQALFSNGRWTYAIALAATVVGLLNTSKVVHAADSSMCIFVKKVLATQEAEFSPLKGKEDIGLGRDKTRFHGTLAPEQGVTCQLYVRRQVGKRILSPEYVCTLIDNITYDQAEARYVAVTSDIKGCLLNWKYTEEKKGDRAQQTELWRLRGTGPSANIKLEVFDWSAAADRFNGTKSATPGASLTLSLGDTAPGPENAKLPVFGKPAQ
jgi:hypothetical protein